MFRVITACAALCLMCFAGLAMFRAFNGEAWMDPIFVGIIYMSPLIAAIVAAAALKMHEKPPVVVGLSTIAFAAAYPLEAAGLITTLVAFIASFVV